MPPSRAPKQKSENGIDDPYSLQHQVEPSCFNFDESRGGTLARSWKYGNPTDEDEYPPIGMKIIIV